MTAYYLLDILDVSFQTYPNLSKFEIYVICFLPLLVCSIKSVFEGSFLLLSFCLSSLSLPPYLMMYWLFLFFLLSVLDYYLLFSSNIEWEYSQNSLGERHKSQNITCSCSVKASFLRCCLSFLLFNFNLSPIIYEV